MAMRTAGRSRLPASGVRRPAFDSQLASHAEVQFEQRRPGRVMLLVEGDVAAAVRLAARFRAAQARASAQVGDGGHWRKQYPASERPDRPAEVHVLGVEEEA